MSVAMEGALFNNKLSFVEAEGVDKKMELKR